jgi:hypothetical protein
MEMSGQLHVPAALHLGNFTASKNVKVKSLCLIKHRFMTYGLIGGIASSFLTSALDGSEWSALPTENSHRYALNRNLFGPQSRSGDFGEEKTLLPFRRLNPGRPARSLSLYLQGYPPYPNYVVNIFRNNVIILIYAYLYVS